MSVQTKDVSGVPVEIKEVAQNTPTEQGTYYSRWHLLVNSNLRAAEGSERANQIADTLKDSVRCVFFEHAKEVFVCKVPGDKFEPPTIQKIEIKMAAEIGSDPRGQRVHVHVLIDVTHHTILSIDVPVMRQAIWDCIRERDPTMPYPFIRLKWIPVNKAIEKYIGKAPVGWT